MNISDLLKQHLLRYRGSWISKLSTELREALKNTGEEDIKKAATVIIHGKPLCEKMKVTRISDGWQFCGNINKCECSKTHFIKKSEETNLEKRGVKNAAQSAEVKQKMKETCLERYGVEYSGASKERQEKVKQTNLERYGTENVFASEEIKEKIKNKLLDEYRIEHISKLPEHQQKMKDAVVKKYGVENVMKLSEIKEKLKQTNLEKYGGNAPACSEQVREKMKQTNIERYGEETPFGQRMHIAEQHRIKDENDFRLRFSGRNAEEISEETGYSTHYIYCYAKKFGIILKTPAKLYMGAENSFSDTLFLEISNDFPFLRNQRILEDGTDKRNNKEIDFYFPEQKFGIEFCGAYWHSDAQGKDSKYHAKKYKLAKNQGIFLIQLFQDEWIDHPLAVMSAIKYRLGLLRNETKIHARKCLIEKVDHTTAINFYNLYHVYGGVGCTVHYGLKFNDDIVACMSFTERYPEKWELVRYATKNLVMGGASKLQTHFEKTHQWDKITSYVDYRWSDGGLYANLGFSYDGEVRPDYAYVVGEKRIHKFNMRKDSARFKKYTGMGLTESEMAKLEGLPRVYDAGKMRVIKKKLF